MLTIAACIFAGCFVTGLIALTCNAAGARADRRDERELRQIQLEQS